MMHNVCIFGLKGDPTGQEHMVFINIQEIFCNNNGKKNKNPCL